MSWSHYTGTGSTINIRHWFHLSTPFFSWEFHLSTHFLLRMQLPICQKVLKAQCWFVVKLCDCRARMCVFTCVLWWDRWGDFLLREHCICSVLSCVELAGKTVSFQQTLTYILFIQEIKVWKMIYVFIAENTDCMLCRYWIEFFQFV